MKTITLYSSYKFKLSSGITASSLVFLLILSLSNWWIAIACTISIVLLFELLKRRLNSLAFKDYLAYHQSSYLSFQPPSPSSTSIISSYYGSKKMVLELTPPPSVISTAEASGRLESQIAQIDKQVESAMNTKRKGTTRLRKLQSTGHRKMAKKITT